MIDVEISNRQTTLRPDEGRLAEAARRVLAGEGVARAVVGVAVVDDRSMRALNRRYLAHDYATDVLSFLLERCDDGLEGEIIVSADTAVAAAARYHWPAEDELLLYVVHGALHLAGWDDATAEEAAAMRLRERHYLGHFGLTPPGESVPRRRADRGAMDDGTEAVVLPGSGGHRTP